METAPAVSAEEAAAFAAIEQLEAAEAALTLTHEQEAAEIAAIEQRAEEHGTNEKSGGVHGNVGSMRRTFERFIEKHDARYLAFPGQSCRRSPQNDCRG